MYTISLRGGLFRFQAAQCPNDLTDVGTFALDMAQMIQSFMFEAACFLHFCGCVVHILARSIAPTLACGVYQDNTRPFACATTCLCEVDIFHLRLRQAWCLFLVAPSHPLSFLALWCLVVVSKCHPLEVLNF